MATHIAQRPRPSTTQESASARSTRRVRAGAGRQAIVDAACGRDPSFEVAEAHDYIEAVPQLRAGLQELNARVLRDLFGPRD